MENKDSPLYRSYTILKYILIVVLVLLSVLFYFFVFSSAENMFGRVSSYYLPIFSFGEGEFPPLEF
jgi:hypothetical protein